MSRKMPLDRRIARFLLWGAPSAALMLTITVGLVQFLVSAQALAAPIRLSAVTTTSHFAVYHYPNMDATARVVGLACEDWLAEISQRLELRTPALARIPVFLYRDQDDFTRATGRERAGEAVGAASSRGSVEIEASGVFASAEQIAGHEIAHIVIFRILGPESRSLPLWVNEGTAKFLTNDWPIADRTVFADAASTGALLPLSSLADRFPGDSREALAYAESASAVRFFVKSYGEPALARLIRETGRTKSFDAAMRETTGLSPQQFERRWLRSSVGTFITPQMMRLVTALGLLLVGLIAILAYATVRRHRRRILERYEREEWEEANWRDWGGR